MKILAIRMTNHPLYPTLSPILSVLSLLPQPSANPYQCTASKALSLKLRKGILGGFERGSQRCSLTVLLTHYSTGCLQRLLIFMNLSLITSSLMNPFVQTSNHSPKNSDSRTAYACKQDLRQFPFPSNQEVSHSPCAFWI